MAPPLYTLLKAGFRQWEALGQGWAIFFGPRAKIDLPRAKEQFAFPLKISVKTKKRSSRPQMSGFPLKAPVKSKKRTSHPLMSYKTKINGSYVGQWDFYCWFSVDSFPWFGSRARETSSRATRARGCPSLPWAIWSHWLEEQKWSSRPQLSCFHWKYRYSEEQKQGIHVLKCSAFHWKYRWKGKQGFHCLWWGPQFSPRP